MESRIRWGRWVASAVFLSVVALAVRSAFPGKLYIKPELERKRVERLLSEADSEFRTAKLHMTLSPEVAITEFRLSLERTRAAIELINIYGEGYYTPGDVEDFEKRINECQMWIKKCEQEIKEKEKQK